MREPHGQDPGIRQDDVEPAELRHPLRDSLRELGEVADVGRGRHDPAIQPFDELDGPCEVVWGGGRIAVDRGDRAADVHRDDVRAFLGQPHGVRSALAARGPGDEGDLAVESTCHG